MNGNFYPNPTFPNGNQETIDLNVPNVELNKETINDALPNDKNTLDYFIKKNLGKTVKAYASFPNSDSWKNKEYIGLIEGVGKDYLIIKNSESNSRYLIKIQNLDYLEFLESINII